MQDLTHINIITIYNCSSPNFEVYNQSLLSKSISIRIGCTYREEESTRTYRCRCIILNIGAVFWYLQLVYYYIIHWYFYFLWPFYHLAVDIMHQASSATTSTSLTCYRCKRWAGSWNYYLSVEPQPPAQLIITRPACMYVLSYLGAWAAIANLKTVFFL